MEWKSGGLEKWNVGMLECWNGRVEEWKPILLLLNSSTFQPFYSLTSPSS